jgi:hypothetical protein
MKNLYPNQLVQRPDDVTLDQTHIHVGDIVYLQPIDGPAIRSTVIFDTPVGGCITYTGDAINATPCDGKQRLRIRFRQRDVHRVQPARMPSVALHCE